MKPLHGNTPFATEAYEFITTILAWDLWWMPQGTRQPGNGYVVAYGGGGTRPGSWIGWYLFDGEMMHFHNGARAPYVPDAVREFALSFLILKQ